MKRSMMMVAVITLTSGIRADEPEITFGTKEAKIAQLSYDEEKKALDESYQKELAVIKKSYAANLTRAKKLAIVSENLKEAQVITDYIKGLEDETKEAPAKAVPATRLTPKDLYGKKFLFSYIDKNNTYQLTMTKEGKLAGGRSPNEQFWKVSPAGQFQILAQDGKTITSRSEVYMNAKGHYVLQGAAFDGMQHYYVEQK